jgi:acetylornithine deacetylase
MEGSTAWNVILDSCTVTIDERTVPDERAPLGELEARPGISVTIDQDLPPMACEESAFADLVRSAASDAQDGRPEQVTKPHATDAGWLSAAGTTCVVCGVAEPGEAHTATESASLSVIDRCRDIYRTAAERFEPSLSGES